MLDGAIISHYRITEKLGEGGMGVVYKAEDTKLGRTVALKFLAPHLLADADHKERFLREAKAVAALDHPNIAMIHEIDEAEGHAFLAMAYVDGASLDRKIKERPLKLDEALDIAIQAAQGLHAAHEKRIIHRDVKSANILLTKKGEVKLTDFGLARFEDHTQHTKSGITLGTPAYMSPEQTVGQSLDRRTDIWSLGVVIYEMVAGRLPFGGEVRHALLYSILNEEPEPLTALRSGVPLELDQLIAKALAKDAANRYQHVDELLVDLKQIRKHLDTAAPERAAAPGRQMSVATVGVGQMLTHYRLESKLGEGGMGVVYRAHDTHLERPVAIKVLSAQAVASADRKSRFVQEAKAASALNHPNIITIHDINSVNGVDFIAMEYVPGKTLEQVAGHKGLTLGEALRYGVQIADALAKAHDRGIVHRDIKPSNIMVSSEGLVKVLDFGLAKLVEPTDESKTSPGGKAIEGREREGTEEGTILGTAAYMSPEQAEGRPVDARSDIFSFGAVLYEMLTGRRAFEGATKLSLLAAILREDPKPPSEIVAGLPREVERVIQRCLRKDPARRYQHMDDLKLALEELKEESDSGQFTSRRPSPQPMRRWLPPVAAACIAAGVGTGAWFWRGESPPPPSQTQAGLVRLTSDAGLATEPAISPDGRLVAYASDRGAAAEAEGNLDIWVQQVSGGERLRLTSNAADEREPSFSPDGTRIVYRSEQDGGGVYVVSTLGGEPRRIARAGRGPRFSPGGDKVAYWTGGSTFQSIVQGKSYVVPAAGGEPRQIQPEFHSVTSPVWSPDGQQILFLGVRDDLEPRALVQEMDWWVTPLAGDRDAAVKTGILPALRERKFLFGGFGGIWIIGGAWLPGDGVESHVLFPARSGDAWNIWQIPIAQRTWQAAGEPRRLTFGAAFERAPSAALLPDGNVRLIFASLSENTDIWSLPLDANSAVARGPMERLTDGADVEARPSVSMDGRTLSYLQGTIQRAWLKDLASGQARELASRGANARLSWDGSKAAFWAGPERGLVVGMTSGSDSETVCDDCYIPTGWSHDGTLLLDEQVAGQPLALVVPGQRKRIPILQHPSFALSLARFSPDGRWISFHAIPDPSTRRVFVAPFRDPRQPGVTPVEEKDWIPITDGQGMERYASWSPDGNLLYFLSERDGFRCLNAQRLHPSTKRPVGPVIEVSHFHQARRSLLAAGDPINVNPSIAVDKVVFGMVEITGNIWMTELEQGTR